LCGTTLKGVQSTTWNGKPAISMKKAKLLGLIDVELETETVVDAGSGMPVAENRPWRGFLAGEKEDAFSAH